jgi:hypothetical protein
VKLEGLGAGRHDFQPNALAAFFPNWVKKPVDVGLVLLDAAHELCGIPPAQLVTDAHQ